jgi:hypothetical protein
MIGMLLPLSALSTASAQTPTVISPIYVDPLSATNITGATHTWTLTCSFAGETASVSLEGPDASNLPMIAAVGNNPSGATTVTAPGFSTNGTYDVYCGGPDDTVTFTITQNTPGTYYLHVAETAPAGHVFNVTAADECADAIGAPIAGTSATCEVTAIKQYAQLTNVFVFPTNAQNFGFWSEPLKTYIFPPHTVVVVAIGEVPVKPGSTCTGTGIFNPATGQFQPAHLEANAAAGQTYLYINPGLYVFSGDVLTINGGKSNQESVVVDSYNASTGKVTLAAPLTNNHAAGEPVTTGLVLVNGVCFEYVGVAGAPFFATVSGSAGASFAASTACDQATGFCPASSPVVDLVTGTTGPGGFAFLTIYGANPGEAFINVSVYTPNCTYSDVTKCPVIATQTVTKTFSIIEGSTVPLIKWAGEKVVLQKYFGTNYAGYPVIFTLSCSVTNGNGCTGKFVSGSNPNSFVVSDNTLNTVVDPDGVARALAESDAPGEMLATASLGEPASNPGNVTSVINEHQFAVYFLKLEDVTLGNVVPQTLTDTSGLGFLSFVPGVLAPGGTVTVGTTMPWGSTATDVTTATVNVCADELLRARVRGWFTGQDQSTRPARAVPTGSASTSVELLPAGRWVLPDDWPALAVGSAGLGAIGGTAAFPNFRPEWDLNGGWPFNQSENVIAGETPSGPFYSMDVFGALYATSGPCGVNDLPLFDNFDFFFASGGPWATGFFGDTLYFAPDSAATPIPVINTAAAQDDYGLDPNEPYDIGGCVYSPIAAYTDVPAPFGFNGTTYSTNGYLYGPSVYFACDELGAGFPQASACQTGAGTIGPFDPLRSYTDPSEAELAGLVGSGNPGGAIGLEGAPYADSPTYGSSYLPNGTLSQYDAVMPPAKIAFLITDPTQSCEAVTVGNSTFAQSATDYLTGAALNFNVSGSCPNGERLAAAMPGYFIPASKDDIYRIAVASTVTGKINKLLYVNPFYYEFIPDNPLIPPHANGQGYDWNSFGAETSTTILGCGVSGGAPATTFGDYCPAGSNYILVDIGATPCYYASGAINPNTSDACTNGGLGGSVIINTNFFGLTPNTGENLAIGGTNCPPAASLPDDEVCISLEGAMATTDYVGATVTTGLQEQSGETQGPYHFWDFIDTDFSSINGTIPYVPIQDQPKEVEVYSDNHGEAMVYLTGLSSDISLAKFLNGLGGLEFPAGATVGATTVEAVADYPYFRYFPPIASNTVTKTWTSAWSKTVTCGTKGVNGLTLPTGKQLCVATLVDICGNPIVGEPVVFSTVGPAIIVPTTVISGTQPVFNGTDTQATVTSDNTGSAAVIVEATGSATLITFFPLEGVNRQTPIGPTPSSVIPVSYAAGWNMVGAPTGTSFLGAQAMYSWSVSANSYTLVPNLTAGSGCAGYFAYFASTTTVNIQAPATAANATQSCALSTGWNLVGNPFTRTAALPSGVQGFYYNPASGSYSTVSTIPTGGSVWIYQGASTSITLTAS